MIAYFGHSLRFHEFFPQAVNIAHHFNFHRSHLQCVKKVNMQHHPLLRFRFVKGFVFVRSIVQNAFSLLPTLGFRSNTDPGLFFVGNVDSHLQREPHVVPIRVEWNSTFGLLSVETCNSPGQRQAFHEFCRFGTQMIREIGDPMTVVKENQCLPTTVVIHAGDRLKSILSVLQKSLIFVANRFVIITQLLANRKFAGIPEGFGLSQARHVCVYFLVWSPFIFYDGWIQQRLLVWMKGVFDHSRNALQLGVLNI
mmetsp:Transcript_20824/g.45326  ORF Transcript_20824/g.45326 Transcript_20824/m.45326 type:complete len:253 (-) Transcript_20824:633-1391(-)